MGRVQWYINGAKVVTENPQLPGTSYRRGDVVSANAEILRKEGDFIISAPAVTVRNALPDAVSADLSTWIPVAGDTVRVSASGRDPDGDGVKFRYQWYADDKLLEGETGESFRVRKGMKGMWIQAEVQAFDGFAKGSLLRTTKVRVLNAPPVVKSVLPGELPPGRKFVYRIEADDADGDPLYFTLTKGPPGMVLAGSTLEWQVPEEYYGKQVDAEVEVSDGLGGKTVQNISMTIQPPR